MKTVVGGVDTVREVFEEESEDRSEQDEVLSDTSDSDFEDHRQSRTALTVWEGADSFFPGFLLEENEDPIDEPESEEGWENCPIVQKADLLYQFCEDTDPRTRVTQFFDQYKNKGFDNIQDYYRMNKYQLSVEDRDPFNDDEAEMKYMWKKPTCFIILGKPLNGSRNLAKRLGEYWGCIVIDAESVVSDELNNYPDGVWGTWLKLTLMKGEAIEPDKIFKLIFEKINSPAAKHVGYVLVGVPMIPNANYSCNGKLASQLDEIFRCDMFPDVIINVTCPEKDVYYLREKLKYDATSGIEIDYNILEQAKAPTRFSVLEDKRQEPYVDEWEEYEKENNKLIDASVMHHCFITMPHNWLSQTNSDLWYYHTHILPDVEKAILGHDQKFVIKLDGRTPSYRMMEVLKAKLEVLPLVRAYPVVMMSRKKSAEGPLGAAEGEGELAASPKESLSVAGEDESNLSIGGSLDKAFAKLIDSQKAGSRFRWHWSTWGKRCPVTSTKFNDVQGKAQFACRFMDKIYFLANEEAAQTFVVNPRPFLTVVEEHLPDRIFIAGSKLSGKTTVAKYIAETLGAKVFDMKDIEVEMLNERPVKRATSSLAKMVYDTMDLAQKEAILHFLSDTYLYHKSLVLYIKYYSNINTMKSIINGANSRADIPARALVFKEDWYRKHMEKEPVPTLNEYRAVKDEYSTMIEVFSRATNNPIAKSWVLPVYDKANNLATRIKEYEGEGTIGQGGNVVHSTKTWIVDNAPLTIEFWKYMQYEGVLPNRVIFLHDEDGDYDFMISKYIESDLYLQLSAKKREALEQAAHDLAVQEARERKAREEEEEANREAKRLAEEKAASEAAEKERERESSEEKEDTSSLTYGEGSPFPVSGSEEILVQETNSEQEQDQEETSNQDQKSKDSDNVSLIEKEILCLSLSSVEVPITNRSLRSASLLLHSLSLPLPEEYAEELAMLDEQWSNMKQYLASRARADTITINGKNLTGLHGIAKERTNAALLPQAHEKSHFEKTMERKIELMTHGDVMVAEDHDDSDQATNLRDLYHKMTSLVQFGDTNTYCPVVFHQRGILYPGKEQYTCVYRDKTYRMSSRKAEEEFLANPTLYVNLKEPIDHSLLAPRICIVGPIGSGKTTLAKLIAKTIKCDYFNFDEMLEKAYMRDFQDKIGRKYEEESVREVLGLPTTNSENSFESEYSDSLPGGDDEGDDKEFKLLGASSKELENIFFDSDMMKEALRGYLVLGKRLPSIVLDRIVAATWYSEPVTSEGMVLDGFPCRQSDIEYMDKRCLVPNLIIHLEVNDSVAVSRVFKDFLEIWQERQEKLRAKVDSRLVTSLIDSDNVSEESDEEEDEEEEYEEASNDYETLGGEEEEESKSNTFGLEPLSRANKRITENIKFWVAEDTNFLRALKAYATAEHIPWTTLPGAVKLRGLWNKSMFALRAANCLEKVHRIRDITMIRYLTHEEADALIKSGYYMLSRFCRRCPVQVYEEENSFPSYKPFPAKDSFPVIYRKYIYYISSLDNLFLFESNPEKYIQEDSYLPLISIRVAVLGPPKSGKTKLASRLAKEFGLRVVSPGDALRYVLMALDWTELAQRLKKHLSKGLTVSPDLLVETVQAFIMEERCTTGGFVYDGFPNNMREAEELEKFGIGPMIVLHIDADLEALARISKTEKMHTSHLGSEQFYSDAHMEYKTKNWCATIPDLLKSLQERYQNVYAVSGPVSKWNLFETCKHLVEYHMLDIQSYDHSIRDGPHGVKSMCISPQEFDRRSGPSSHYCIVCWATLYQLITEGYPPPSHGVFQYKNKFYYVCPSHQRDFLMRPQDFVNVDKQGRKAPHLPSRIASSEGDKLYANGLCIVTYVNQKNPCRVKGDQSLAVKYGEYVYLFANKKCQTLFLENPELYCGRKIRYQEPPSVEFDIPPTLTLGYLEQSVSRVVNAAVTSLVEFRPALSRVDMVMYATVYVALQLLVRNPPTEAAIKRWAQEQISRYQDDQQLVNSVFRACQLQLKKTTQEFL